MSKTCAFEFSFKKQLVLSLLLVAGIVAVDQTIKRFKLSNPVLKSLDGIPGALDGYTFEGILHLRRTSRVIQYGAKDQSSGKLIGKYEWEGKHYSVHQLARIEKKMDDWFEEKIRQLDEEQLNQETYKKALTTTLDSLKHEYQKEMHEKEAVITRSVSHDHQEIELAKLHRKMTKRHIKECSKIKESLKRPHMLNPHEYDTKYAILKHEYEQKTNSIKAVFMQAKSDFRKVMDPYSVQIHGIKLLLYRLVVESCKLRGRDGSDGKYPSVLLKWAEVADGKEFEALEKNIKKFQDFDLFLTDLSNFFQDLIDSCPKGWAQCQEILKQHAK